MPIRLMDLKLHQVRAIESLGRVSFSYRIRSSLVETGYVEHHGKGTGRGIEVQR